MKQTAEATKAPCGCNPGFFFCPEAERLWRLYMTHLREARAAIVQADKEE